MSAFYEAMKATSMGLLAKFGQTMTLRKIAPGTYDPTTGTATPVQTDISVTGAIFDVKDERINGATVLRGDKRALVAAKGMAVVPEANSDRLVVQGVVHQIVAVKPLAPAGIPVIYEMQVRRAA